MIENSYCNIFYLDYYVVNRFMSIICNLPTLFSLIYRIIVLFMFSKFKTRILSYFYIYVVFHMMYKRLKFFFCKCQRKYTNIRETVKIKNV